MLCFKGLVFCFYLGRSGSILQFRQNIIKVGSKSWLLTCSSNITLSLPSYTGSVLKRELNFCNGYLSLLYFWVDLMDLLIFSELWLEVASILFVDVSGSKIVRGKKKIGTTTLCTPQGTTFGLFLTKEGWGYVRYVCLFYFSFQDVFRAT